MYDNVVEYWVMVRETGAYEEDHEVAEKRRSTSKAHLVFSQLSLPIKI